MHGELVAVAAPDGVGEPGGPQREPVRPTPPPVAPPPGSPSDRSRALAALVRAEGRQ